MEKNVFIILTPYTAGHMYLPVCLVMIAEFEVIPLTVLNLHLIYILEEKTLILSICYIPHAFCEFSVRALYEENI